MTAGQLTATFTGVPVGTAAVTMEAFDISGQLIGSNSRSTTVIAGSTTSVSVPLTLNPTVLPTVGGSGGGTSSPSTGGVAVNGTLSDGYTMQAFAIGSAPSLALAVDPNGDDKWILTGDGSSSANLVHLAAAGTLLKTYPLINVQFRSVFIDSQGTVRVFGPQNDEYLDQATDTVIGDGTRYSGYAAAAPDGTWWQSFLADTRVEQRSSSGASLQLVDAGFAPSDLALSPDGSLWVLHDNWDPQASLPGVITTARFDGAGNQLASVVLDTVGDSIATDSQGNAWLGTFEGLVKVAPDGSVLGTYLNTFVSDAIVDAQDRVWALGVGRLYHVDTGGEILATLDMPVAVDLSNTTSFTPASSGASLAFDSLGDLWVDCGATSVVKVDVP